MSNISTHVSYSRRKRGNLTSPSLSAPEFRRTHLRSYRESEHRHDAVHGLVFPPDGARAVGGVVPVARAGGVEARSGLLHDRARDHVLEGLLQLAEGAQALLRDGGAPLVHLLLGVGAHADGRVDRFVDDLAHVFHDELVLVVVHGWRILTDG